MNPYNDCNLKIINGTPDAAFDYFLQKTILKLLIEKQVAAVLKLQTRIDETESSNRISWRHLMSLASFVCSKIVSVVHLSQRWGKSREISNFLYVNIIIQNGLSFNYSPTHNNQRILVWSIQTKRNHNNPILRL